MIHIKRSEEPAGLIKASDDEIKNNKPLIVANKKCKFAAYKNENVKLKLNGLFHGKCAYCESRFSSIHPVDIEHWRPKSEVVNFYPYGNGKPEPGYAWLAADWNNLLPSCIDCNRARNYEMTSEKGEKVKISLGKANQFPLAPNSQKITWDGSDNLPDVSKEQPLLLNPCIDNPEKHLKFVNQKPLEGVVLPKDTCDEKKLPKGETSIQIYGLNRPGLVLERQERMLEIKRHIELIKRLLIVMNKLDKSSEIYQLLDQLVEYEKQNLSCYQQPEQPFATLARQVIAENLRPPVQ